MTKSRRRYWVQQLTRESRGIEVMLNVCRNSPLLSQTLEINEGEVTYCNRSDQQRDLLHGQHRVR